LAGIGKINPDARASGIWWSGDEAKNAELDLTAKFKVRPVSRHYSIEALAVAPALSTPAKPSAVVGVFFKFGPSLLG
jgi:hypothetical protein